MIGYPIDEDELRQIIEDRLPPTRNRDGSERRNARVAWHLRAEQETRRLMDQGGFLVGPFGEFWRELIPIFAELQGGKCAYCERKLARHRNGRVVGDIEHFRPKNGVIDWRTSHAIATGRDSEGYYWLAFTPSNYLLSCSVCNQDFKRNYFPIAGTRCPIGLSGTEVLHAEAAYLIHPLDPSESDPEELIEFLGINAVPKAGIHTNNTRRATLTIEILGLSKGQREDLDYDRARVITELFIALNVEATGEPSARQVIDALADNRLPHRNCARSFARLYKDNKLKASEVAREAFAVIHEPERQTGERV